MRKYASDIEALGSGTTFKEVSKGIVERFISVERKNQKISLIPFYKRHLGGNCSHGSRRITAIILWEMPLKKTVRQLTKIPIISHCHEGKT